MNRSIYFQLSILAIAMILLASCGPGGTISDKKILNIGVVIPLTGSGSDQGVWTQQGLELAKEFIQADSGQQINLIYEDSKGGNPADAISGYKALSTKAKVPAIVTWGSGAGMALIPLTNDDHVVQMGVATATPKYRTLGDYSYRTFPSAALEGAYDAKLLKDLGANEVAIAYVNNDYGVAQKEAFASEFVRLGGRIVETQALAPSGSDYRTEIEKLKLANAPYLFLPVYPTEGIVFLRQASEAGFTPKMVASSAINGIALRTAFPKNEISLLVSQQYFDLASSDPLTSRFIQAYKTRYGTNPDVYVARSFDSLYVLLNAIKTCESYLDGDCLAKNLQGMAPIKLTTGPVSFDEAGDLADASFQLFELKNGDLVPYTA